MSGRGRNTRLASALRDELAQLIPSEVKDPRIARAGIPSVNKVELNSDGSIARVYVSFVGADAKDVDTALAALDRAAGFLRGPLGRRMKLGRVPKLRFLYDPTAEVSATLAELVREDAARHVDSDDGSEGDR